MKVDARGRGQLLSLAAIGLFGWACAGGTTQEGTESGVWPTEQWPTSTPAAEGIDPAAVDSLIADIDAGAYGLVDHFLLIRNGRVVADRQFVQDYDSVAALYDTTHHQYNYDDPAWHPYYQNTNLHTLQSVTKSVTSAALGIAMDEGWIEGVTVPVMSFFEAYEHDLSDPRKQDITLEDLLTMRSGIEWHTEGGYDSDEHSTIQLEASDNWIQFVLDMPMDTLSGAVFEYNDGVSVLIGKVLREATGLRADEWAAERLFRPIGIDEYYWKITPDGEADTEGGLYLTTHDLARIGYLFLRNGEWNGARIISPEWISASTRPVVADVAPNSDRTNAGYGYQWWVPDHADGQTQVYAANGYGGQFLLVVPEYDVVAVFNGWNIHGGNIRSTYRALQERLLPAMER